MGAEAEAANLFRESLQVERDARFALELLLFHPARFLRQQLTEFEIGSAEPINLERLDVLTHERQHLNPPLVPLHFVTAHFVRQQCLVNRLLLRRPRELAPPYGRNTAPALAHTHS